MNNLIEGSSINFPMNNEYTFVKNFCFNLGFNKSKETTIEIKFADKGRYQLDNIKIVCQPFINYPAQLEKLQKYGLYNVSFGMDHLSGDIDVDVPSWLCTTLPYDEGWSAVVDGKFQKPFIANYMFLGLKLEPGQHHIEFNYEAPWLFQGCLISLLGFFALIVIFIYFDRPFGRYNGRWMKRIEELSQLQINRRGKFMTKQEFSQEGAGYDK
jgi:uncharacterized membrane protein YfhO